MKITKQAWCLAAGGLLLVVGGLFATSRANMGLTDGRVVGYEGRLDVDGLPAQGNHAFRFALFGNEADNADCLASVQGGDACGLWWAEHLTVPVNAGAFSVQLGETKVLGDDVLLGNNRLFLAIAVKGATDTDFTLLGGKQQILAVPFGARAASAKDYTVGGNLVVQGDQDIEGSLNFGTATRQMINLYEQTYAIGVQPYTLYMRSYDDFAWFKGGTHSNNRMDPGAGGSIMMKLDNAGLTVAGDVNARRFAPQYDSGWVAVNSYSNNEVAFNHNFGSVPSQVMLHNCGFQPSNQFAACGGRTILTGTQGAFHGTHGSNPIDLTADSNTVWASIWSGACAWEHYYPPNNGWVIASSDCKSAWYRVYAWR